MKLNESKYPEKMQKVEVELWPYRTGEKCPQCGKAELSIHIQWEEKGFGMHHATKHSCEHYRKRVHDSPCRYCGKLNTPVRQVPVMIPVSDCYCDDCVDKCRADYAPVRQAMIDDYQAKKSGITTGEN